MAEPLVATPSLIHQNEGGDRGGYLRLIDPANDNTEGFIAPQSFHGDLSAAVGGWVVFDKRATANPLPTLTEDYFFPFDGVVMTGRGITLVGETRVATNGAWIRTSVPLTEGRWRIDTCAGVLASEELIQWVLSDVTSLMIKGEDFDLAETQDLDNVAIVARDDSAACGPSWNLRDDHVPTARWRHAAAVDTARGLLVLYGGAGLETDTWAYNLNTQVWTKVHPGGASAPGPKVGHAMVYDPHRDRIVLTGGGDARWSVDGKTETTGLFPRSREVWEFNTATNLWTRATSLPNTRRAHAMVYDSNRNVTLLYGGRESSEPGAFSVLERPTDGDGEWIAREANLHPGSQFAHSMAFDAARNRVVLVGSGTPSVSVWEWESSASGGVWTSVSLPGAPASRINATLTYVPVGGNPRVVLAGGMDGTTDFNGVFEYNGVSWTQRGSIRENGAIVPRCYHAAAWDPVAQRLLVVGGLNGETNPKRSLLAWNPANYVWSDRWEVTSRPPTWFGYAALDQATGKAVFFGGGVVTRDPRTIRTGAGGAVWSAMGWMFAPSNMPAPAWKGPSVVMNARREMLVYGGEINDNFTPAGNLWRLKLDSLTWEDISPSVTPPPGKRARHAMAYDSARQRAVVFGGRDEVGTWLPDTWEFNPSTLQWELKKPATSPPPLIWPSMTYDERRGVVVLFGGASGVSPTIYRNETWEWDGVHWTQNHTTDAPSPRNRPHITYVPARGTVLLFGGEASPALNSLGLDDVWEYNGQSWRQHLTADPQRPVGLGNGQSYFDPARNVLVHFGGAGILGNPDSEETLSGQVWELSPPSTIAVWSEPTDTDVRSGQDVILSACTAAGLTGVSVQWRRNGVAIEDGAGGASPEGGVVSGSAGQLPSPTTGDPVFLTIASAKVGDSGKYVAVFTNACGDVLTEGAMVTVHCVADFDRTGFVDTDDFTSFVLAFESGTEDADVDSTGFVDTDDFTAFVLAFEAGC